jgi:HAD superfamily (subfamily IA) hydrolase, TIGR02254
MTKKYKYFLFDLDRTLWDFDANARNNIFSLLDKYTITDDKQGFFDNYDRINHTLWAEYERGAMTKEELKGERFYRTLKIYGTDNRDMAQQIGDEYLEQMPFQKALMPNAMEVLSELNNRGCKMAVVTNGFKEVQYKKLEVSGIAKFFDAVMVSEEQGVNKPCPIIFKRALKAIGGDKELAIMVGDDFANDIEGAMIFGIDQFFYNYKSIPCDGGPTYNSADLRDLLAL